MNVSESIISNLLIEVDTLTHRLRNINQSFNSTFNQRLRERLLFENKTIFNRVSEVYKLAEFQNIRSSGNLNASALLVEKCKRTLEENKSETNLFFL